MAAPSRPVSVVSRTLSLPPGLLQFAASRLSLNLSDFGARAPGDFPEDQQVSMSDKPASPKTGEPRNESHHKSSLGDFTADRRLLFLTALAIPTGLLCAVVALLLQRLIGFFTNVFYYQTFSIPETLIPPSNNTMGWLAILVPIAGGIVIGLMARYGSDRIRGHGIPEAMEAILIGRSRMQPKVAILKPLSSAISIGSGGPFGAEGPIIVTGGAMGSIFAQIFNLTAAERKTLLVAGAAGGMSATFGTPIAAVLLGIEVLLFEWKPRSLVPVAMASAVAAMVRGDIGLDPAPLFRVPLHMDFPGINILLAAVVAGLLAGLLSLLLTTAVYGAEDAFQRLPVHWMWWPAIGGVVVGIGGYFEPRALGVGYEIIGQLINGEFVPKALILLMVVKAVIWAVALGSGTSGGILAPLLMIGGILGAFESNLFPGDARLWPLVSMAAVMAGTMRAPFTGILFALELTYDVRALLPLMVASTTCYAFTVLVMKRSILTEKVARRGYHVSQEFSIDPLERLSVADAMAADVIHVPASTSIRELVSRYFLGGSTQKHQGYPVVDDNGRLLGVVTKSDLLDEWMLQLMNGRRPDEIYTENIITYDLVNRTAITAFPWESCRTAAERMARLGVGRLPVVDPDDPLVIVGIITRSDLLKSRARMADEESRRERFISPKLPMRFRAK